MLILILHSLLIFFFIFHRFLLLEIFVKKKNTHFYVSFYTGKYQEERDNRGREIKDIFTQVLFWLQCYYLLDSLVR